MSVEALEQGFVQERETGVFARAGVLRRLARDRVAAIAGLVSDAPCKPHHDGGRPRHGGFS